MLVRFPWRRSMLGDGEPSAREESKTTLSLQGMASDLKVTWAKRHWQAKMQIVEAPTLRLNQGDTLNLDVLDRIEDDDKDAKKMKMKMSSAAGKTCGDGG